MLRSRVSAVLSAVLFVVSVGFVSQGSAVAAPAGCPDHISFAVGGVGDPAGNQVPYVPAGPRTNIHYPASISPAGGSTSGDESVRVGTANLRGSVAAFRAQCPDSQVNLVGFSLGAVVVSDVCDGIRGDAARNVTCYTTGNPKRQGSGIMGNVPSVIPGFTHTGNRVAPADGPRIVERCNARDIYCAGGNPLADPGRFVDAAVGTYLQGQHGYPVVPVAPVLPSTPLPVPVTARQVFEPVLQEVLPAAPIRSVYVPTPVKDLVPAAIGRVLPPVVGDFVPGPLPTLPRLP